jgi:serine/threonine-protein kinase HipA
MNLLNKIDGEKNSYLELVDFIKANCISVNDNLKELYKRIIFNILISNTDDHFRNHGFILKENGWVISPMYDINPIKSIWIKKNKIKKDIKEINQSVT